MLHTGINDVKRKDAILCGKNMASAVKTVQSIFPQAHVVCSRALPVKQQNLEAKRTVYNAHTFHANTERNTKNISYISHENIVRYKHLKDDVHPTEQGASILARNHDVMCYLIIFHLK